MSAADACCAPFSAPPSITGAGETWSGSARSGRTATASRSSAPCSLGIRELLATDILNSPAIDLDLSLSALLPRHALWLVRRAQRQIAESREDARDEGSPQATARAEEHCLKVASLVIERAFWQSAIQFVASGTLDGGAVFVANNRKNGKRADFEIPPDGGSARVFASIRGKKPRNETLGEDSAVCRWVDWLLS